MKEKTSKEAKGNVFFSALLKWLNTQVPGFKSLMGFFKFTYWMYGKRKKSKALVRHLIVLLHSSMIKWFK